MVFESVNGVSDGQYYVSPYSGTNDKDLQYALWFLMNPNLTKYDTAGAQVWLDNPLLTPWVSLAEDVFVWAAYSPQELFCFQRPQPCRTAHSAGITVLGNENRRVGLFAKNIFL
jgi:hypothetical protein